MTAQTLGQRMDAYNGQTSGFDYLRLMLACGIVCWHSIITTYGNNEEIWRGPLRPFGAILLPMFFSLSGFLVAASLERTRTLIRFFTYRAVRIIPALSVEVLLSALLLGPMVTTYAASDYFRDPELYRYFFNIIGHVQFVLPGVFMDNPYTGIVNVSLWTIPYELYCYLTLALLAPFGLLQGRQHLLLLLTGFLTLVLFFNPDVSPDMQQTRTIPGWSLVLSFLYGVLLSRYRQRVPFSPLLGFASAIAGIGLLFNAGHIYLAIIPLAYLTVFLGLQNPPKLRLLKSGDYSYGIYLFAFPIQQGFTLLAGDLRSWWLNILICLPLSFAYAVFSWHCIEKRVLAHKASLADRAERLLNRRG